MEEKFEKQAELGKKVLSMLYAYNKINLAEYGWVIRKHPEYLYKLSRFAENIDNLNVEKAYEVIESLLKNNLY